MYNKLIMVFLIIFLAACSSSPDTKAKVQKAEVVKAQSAETQKTKTETTAATKDSDLICRTERPLGTRFGKKVCRTRSQIAEERKQAKDLMPRHRECTGPREVCI